LKWVVEVAASLYFVFGQNFPQGRCEAIRFFLVWMMESIFGHFKLKIRRFQRVAKDGAER